MAFSNDKMYYYSVTYDASYNATNAYYVSTIDAAGLDGESLGFMDTTVAAGIESPYYIGVQPCDGTIFITDAKNYVSSGSVYCLDNTGKLLWSVKAGDIPACIAFYKI